MEASDPNIPPGNRNTKQLLEAAQLRYKEMNKTILNSSDLFGCTNCTSDSSHVDWTLSLTSVIALSVITVAGSILGMLGNSLVLLAIARNVNFRSVPDFLIFSLALSDLIVSTIYVPLYVNNVIRYHVIKNNATYRMVRSFVGHLALLASIANVVGITIDRLTAVSWPLRYQKLMTKKFAVIFILLAWMTSAAISAAYSFFQPSRVFLWCYCMILLLATILMYIYIFKVAHAQRNRIVAMRYRDDEESSQRTPDSSEERRAAKTLKERKAAKTFAIVIGVFFVTWIPLLIYTAAASKMSKSWYEGFLWAESFSLWNSFINPYIYFARSRRYRSMALQMLRIKRSQWKRPIARRSQVGIETGTTPNS